VRYVPIRRKCFISYHHADQAHVERFERTFDEYHNVFIARRLGQMPSDIIDSNNTDYVMSKIRSDYIQDSTVTIVLMGGCTWARRYVDWEIQSSLRSGETTNPNGLLGIKLPTFTQFPNRFDINLTHSGDTPGRAYAGWIDYPTSLDMLINAIEWAYDRRTTHSAWIKNPRDRMTYNRECIR
jgi:hypothetical protein